MTTHKDSRIVFFKELAKMVNPTGTIGHVPGTFLQELKKYLNFSDNEIATLFGVSRPAIVRKRNAAETEPASIPQPDRSGDMTIEDFMNADLSPEKELEFLKQYGREMLKTLPQGSQARMTLYRLLVEHSEKRLKNDFEEDKTLLTQILKELTTAIFETRDQLTEEFKKEIRKSLTVFVEELKAAPDRDPALIRDALVSQLADFDVFESHKDILLSKPHIRQAYEMGKAEREADTKTPSYVGAGVVRKGLAEGLTNGEEPSKPGGAQYRQAKRRRELEKE